MRYFYVFFLILFFFNPMLYAKQTDQVNTDIQKLVSQIKNAPSSKKRVLINQLKVILREANTDTRIKIMNDLKSTFAKNTVTTHGSLTKQRSKMGENAVAQDSVIMQGTQSTMQSVPSWQGTQIQNQGGRSR